MGAVCLYESKTIYHNFFKFTYKKVKGYLFSPFIACKVNLNVYVNWFFSSISEKLMWCLMSDL